MSTVLFLCVLAAAAWLVLIVVARVTSSEPKESVADYSRALRAISPAPPERRAAPRRRPPPRRR